MPKECGWKSVADRIRGLVAEDRLAETLEILRGLAPQELQDVGNLLARRLKHLRSQQISGTLTQTDIPAERSKIAASLLMLASDLEKRDDQGESAVLQPHIPSRPLASPLAAKELEKIITSSRNIRPIAWLKEGIKAARSVCRVKAPKGIGTGFVFYPGVVMTNNHVIPSADIAARSVAQFNFEESLDGQIGPVYAYPLAPDALFRTSSVDELDYTIVALQSLPENPPLDQWGHLDVDPDCHVYPGDSVCIIQHPFGGHKKIAVGTNHVTGVWDHRLHYLTDTQFGSSGSPVFNEEWCVIAIHHAGGEMQITPRGDTRYVNEGILMKSIREDMGEAWLSLHELLPDTIET